ncbi:MAG: monomethylamine:corrinoid methyltransferase [Thermosphaera sp.]
MSLLWEVLERSQTGPLMKEEEFETEFFPSKIREIVKEHGIKYDPEEVVMTDANMADEIFEAGLELLLEVGLYNKDTKRIVKFTEEEIKEVLATRKRELVLGEGRDQIVLRPRKPEDREPPKTFLPAGILTSNIELYKAYVLSAAKEPVADGLIALPLQGIGELKPVSGTPSETLLGLTEGFILREAAVRVGRPGMFLGIPMSVSSAKAVMGSFHPAGYTRYNCMCPVHIIQDMRIDYDRLNLAFFAQQNGINPWISSCPTMYAYIGGPEEAAVEGIAHVLGMMAYSGGSFAQAMSATIQGRYEGRDVFWANSAQALAAERNIRVPWISFGGGVTGQQATEVSFYSIAATVITNTISGMEGMWLTGGVPGIEGRWGGEVARAAAGIKVSDGVEIVKELLKRYEDKAKVGLPSETLILEKYDMKTLTPKKEYVELYSRMKKELQDMGLEYEAW